MIRRTRPNPRRLGLPAFQLVPVGPPLGLPVELLELVALLPVPLVEPALLAAPLH